MIACCKTKWNLKIPRTLRNANRGNQEEPTSNIAASFSRRHAWFAAADAQAYMIITRVCIPAHSQAKRARESEFPIKFDFLFTPRHGTHSQYICTFVCASKLLNTHQREERENPTCILHIIVIIITYELVNNKSARARVCRHIRTHPHTNTYRAHSEIQHGACH